MLKKLFSICNDKQHKIICVLGIRFKFLNKKKIRKIINENIKLKEKNKQYLEAIKTNPEMFEIYIKNPKLKKTDEERAPFARKKIENMLSQKQFPLFYLVEIETMNKCNGECAFCPVNKFDDPREFKLMDEKLFYNIINQLKELKYIGRVQVFSNNEPLMDKRIFDFVRYAKETLPNAHNLLFTNSTLLNLEKFNKLIPYLDTFCLDIYHNGKEFIPENLKPIVDLCLRDTKLQKRVKIQFIDKCAIRNNRGGKSKNRKNVYQLQTPCLEPFIQVVIRPDGKLSLCCNDAMGEYTLGDLNTEKLIDIWNGKKYIELRQKAKYDRKQIDKCINCDAFGGFGVNSSPDYVFTEKQFDDSWNYIKKHHLFSGSITK